jgi:hypothetical protein
VSSDVSSRLDDTSGLERTDRDGRKERGKEEVVAGRNDDDIELLGIEVLEERGGSPS